MTKDEAKQKLAQARKLLDEVDSLMADVELACDAADLLADSDYGDGDMCGVVRESINELEAVANGL